MVRKGVELKLPLQALSERPFASTGYLLAQPCFTVLRCSNRVEVSAAASSHDSLLTTYYSLLTTHYQLPTTVLSASLFAALNVRARRAKAHL
jgi:hypothetical protein